MPEKNYIDIVVAFIIFLISASDFYKGFLMVFHNKYPLLFMAKVGFSLINLLPSSIRKNQYEKAWNAYLQRGKLYGAYALLGGFSGILLSILLLLSV